MDCQKCKKPNEIDFKNLDANHLLQEEIHLIQKEPKAVITENLYTCDQHENQKIIKYCTIHDEFCCEDCIDDHITDHNKENLPK